MPNEYIPSPWQTAMLHLFMREWLSAPQRHKEVTLYLLGGQKVRGTLHFESELIESPGNYVGADQKAINRLAKSGDVCLKVEKGTFRTHASCVVGYEI